MHRRVYILECCGLCDEDGDGGWLHDVVAATAFVAVVVAAVICLPGAGAIAVVADATAGDIDDAVVTDTIAVAALHLLL